MNLLKEPILFMDTETTGKMNFRLPVTHENQPHIIQCGMLLANDEKEFCVLDYMVNAPKEISEGAAEVHGISNEDVIMGGIPSKVNAAIFNNMVKKAAVIVCHNASFDISMFEAEYYRYGYDFSMIREKPKICTMKQLTPVVKSPPTERMKQYGHNHYKWPTLSECHVHYFGEDFEDAHSAIVDVRAMARVFYAAVKNGDGFTVSADV